MGFSKQREGCFPASGSDKGEVRARPELGWGLSWEQVPGRTPWIWTLGTLGILSSVLGASKEVAAHMPLTQLLGMWEPGDHFRDELPQLCSRPWISLNLTVGTFPEIWLKTKRKDQVAKASSAWAHWQMSTSPEAEGIWKELWRPPSDLEDSSVGVVWVDSCYPDPESIPGWGR